MPERKEGPIQKKIELDDDDRIRIQEAFERDMVPRLKKLHARVGTLNCVFAGDEYGSWNIRFNSTGSDFDIIDFEYPYWHTTQDTADKVSAESLGRIGHVLEVFLETSTSGDSS